MIIDTVLILHIWYYQIDIIMWSIDEKREKIIALYIYL